MRTEHSEKSSPPRWAEGLLRFLLRDRDRDSVSGDLLEEYQQAILPRGGRLRANIWYVRQTLSFVHSVTFGIALGVLFGVWNLLDTLFAPLAEDTGTALLAFYGPMFVIWGIVGFMACRRTGRFLDAAKSGLIVGAITILVFSLMAFLRINIFLEAMRQRSDWQDLIKAFQNSGFESFRAYVNYSYMAQIVPKVVAGICIGSVTGSVGGLVHKLSRESQPARSRNY